MRTFDFVKQLLMFAMLAPRLPWLSSVSLGRLDRYATLVSLNSCDSGRIVASHRAFAAD